eukprot:TRINITY_DN4274_c1_g1_i2.p1 TRINITY_DN4274_c1_g1~~TRINITY_DN4274_c1_g1_i2.p1  ORF type:complete len:315 (-),score=45.09 TRINITY_DN4274_c1_g1_i2:263-1162(-)
MRTCVTVSSPYKTLFFSKKSIRPITQKLSKQPIKIVAQGEEQQQSQDAVKAAITEFVDDFVKDGQVIGLGTGYMATMVIQYIGEKIKDGRLKGVVGVASSDLSASEAAFIGLRMKVSADVDKIDLLFTDVDEIDTTVGKGFPFVFGRNAEPQQPQIPRMRVVLDKADCVVALVDDSIKCVDRLSWALPVVIQDEGWEDTAEALDDEFLGDAEIWRRAFSGTSNPRGGDNPYISPEGHNILDIRFYDGYKLLGEPAAYKDIVKSIMSTEGVVMTGLMLRGADYVVVAGEKGTRVLDRSST